MRRFRRSIALVLLLAVAAAAVLPAPTLADPERGWFAARAPGEAQPDQIVKQSFDLLLDRFVIPPNSADVLNGGWKAALKLLSEKGAENLPGEDVGFSGDRSADWRLFLERYDRLAGPAEGKLDQIQLDRTLVSGMAAAMEEGHTYYLTPEVFRDAQAAIRNNIRYAGIGARFNRELVVIEVFEDSPAESGGLKPGDQLIAVDGASVEGLTPFEASGKVKGDAGTPVELTLRREGTAEPVKLNIVRAEIQVDWLSHRVTDDGVGYLQIRNFPAPDALGAFRTAMDRFDEADIKALVIDVRGNGGGSVDTGISILSRFVPQRQPLFQRIDRQGGQRTVTAFGDYWGRTMPVAVLADGGSGSMSEILASAMQENGVARVFGVKTSGNVAGTNYHPLSDGSALAVTSLVINSGTGRVLNNVGLEPDEVVDLDAGALRRGHDNQFNAALGYVRQELRTRAALLAPAAEDLPLAS